MQGSHRNTRKSTQPYWKWSPVLLMQNEKSHIPKATGREGDKPCSNSPFVWSSVSGSGSEILWQPNLNMTTYGISMKITTQLRALSPGLGLAADKITLRSNYLWKWPYRAKKAKQISLCDRHFWQFRLCYTISIFHTASAITVSFPRTVHSHKASRLWGFLQLRWVQLKMEALLAGDV